jgi:hypothetical protein
VLSGRGLCDELITRPEESYRLWCVVCDQETSKTRRLKARYRAVKIQPQWVVTPGKQLLRKSQRDSIKIRRYPDTTNAVTLTARDAGITYNYTRMFIVV